jgi:hypothetical protein
MRARQTIFAGILAALSALPGISATLSVQATATPVAGLFNYTYQFSIGGAGASVGNIYLGSADLSPLNVVLDVNGNPAGAWSWLGNDTPQNYLQFFTLSGPALGSGDVLDVTFSSALPPGANFAVGLDRAAGATNTVTGVLAPGATAAPEPGSLVLIFSGIALIFIARWCGPAFSATRKSKAR